MFKKIALALLLVMLVACAAPAPPAEVVEPTLAAEVIEAPKSVELLMWGEWCGLLAPEGCNPWNETYCDGSIKEPGDMGRRWVEEWHKLHPEYGHINIKCIIATYGGGRIGTELMAMVRAGEGPNIYTLYGGRSWLAYEIGIDLNKYVSDEDKARFLDYEQWLAEDSTLLVMPGWGEIAYPVANKQLIERACAQDGFDCAPPEPWSVMPYDEYLEIAEAIKALNDGSYMEVLFGMNPSSQHLNWGYFAQVGIPAFRDGKFTGFEGGEDVLAELLRLYDEGYFYPDVAGLNDDDAFAIWARGKIGVHMARLSFDVFKDNAVAAGECEPWDLIPLIGIQFRDDVMPLVTGGYFSGAGFVADNTSEEHRAAAVSFLSYVLSYPWGGVGATPDCLLYQYSQIERGMVEPGSRDEIFAYIDEYGLAEHGLQHEAYNQVREALAKLLTTVFLHELTPAEGLAQFQATVMELTSE